MNLLDENLLESQRQVLRSWRMRVRKVGLGFGRRGMEDEEILTLLHQISRPTFFTRDLDFYDRRLCHAGYCLVFLELGPSEAASFIRRFLRQPTYQTQAKRMGKVVLVRHTGVRFWQLLTVA